MIFNEFIAEAKRRKLRSGFQNFYWYEKRVK